MSLISEQVVVDEQDAGIRLDKWLAEALQELEYDASRSQVQHWLDAGYITAARPRLKASDVTVAGEQYVIDVPDPQPIELVGDDIPVDVVFEDEDVVVVNKPRGLVVHPAAGHPRGTLVNALLYRGTTLSHLGGAMRPGVVHRIDKDTSGLLMLAKSDAAYHALAAQLKEHTAHRVYAAIVHGKVVHDDGMIDAPIGRDPQNRQRMAVRDGGKHAITHFHVVERFQNYSYLELRLETGRTHQIRVHMAYIDHPLAGDPLYGRRHTLDIGGQALHAMELGFTHPKTGEAMAFHAPLPDDMQTLLHGLRADLIS